MVTGLKLKSIPVLVKALGTGLLCALLFWRVSGEYQNIGVKILNYLIPSLSFSGLVEVEASPSPAEPAFIRRHMRYFAYVAQYLPERADAYAMVGFCQAKLNHTQAALKAYQQAAKITPKVAWVYYNMGVLYLKRKDFALAKESFEKALAVPVEDNIAFIRNSKVYLDILRQVPQINMEEKLKATYALSYQLSLISAGGDGFPASRLDWDNDLPGTRMF